MSVNYQRMLHRVVQNIESSEVSNTLNLGSVRKKKLNDGRVSAVGVQTTPHMDLDKEQNLMKQATDALKKMNIVVFRNDIHRKSLQLNDT